MRVVATMFACAVLCSGCATITRGRTQTWSVQTEPTGANVRLSSGETCITPCTLTKMRRDPFFVTINMPGFQQVETQVVSAVKGAGAAGMAGNIIFGGLIGVGVDAATGATKDLLPNPLIVRMVPNGMPMPAGGGVVNPVIVEAQKNPSDGRQARLNAYGPSAKSELAKMHCDQNFKFLSSADGQEVYQASCAGGTTQQMECDGVACKPVK